MRPRSIHDYEQANHKRFISNMNCKLKCDCYCSLQI